MASRLPMIVKAWFALDLLLALFPPIHWWASGGDPVFGVPRVLFYVYGTSAFIAASVVAAYVTDRGPGGHAEGEG